MMAGISYAKHEPPATCERSDCRVRDYGASGMCETGSNYDKAGNLLPAKWTHSHRRECMACGKSWDALSPDRKGVADAFEKLPAPNLGPMTGV